MHRLPSLGISTGAVMALREAHEEAGLDASTLTVLETIPGADHGNWSYTYVLAEAARPKEDELEAAGVRVTEVPGEVRDDVVVLTWSC